MSAPTSVAIESRTVSIPVAARELGISRGLAYQLARKDELPVPVLPLGGRRLAVSRDALDAVLAAGKPARPEAI